MKKPLKILLCYNFQKKVGGSIVSSGDGDTISTIGDGMLNEWNVQDIRGRIASTLGEGFSVVITSIIRLDDDALTATPPTA